MHKRGGGTPMLPQPTSGFFAANERRDGRRRQQAVLPHQQTTDLVGEGMKGKKVSRSFQCQSSPEIEKNSRIFGAPCWHEPS